MAFHVRICKNCRTAQPMTEPAQCQHCGDDTEPGELFGAFAEQGRELQKAQDELLQIEEGSSG